MPFLATTTARLAALVLGVGTAGAGGVVLYDAAKPDPLPLLPATRLYAPAPPADDLPFAAPSPIGFVADPYDAYAWPERAYALNVAFQPFPPDYAYFYDRVENWVWVSDDRWLLEVEPLTVGERWYYYAPGREHPYFILDEGWGYGFDGDALVLVIEPDGSLAAPAVVRARSDRAGRYLLRAQELREARQRAREEDQIWGVSRDRWQARRTRLVADQARLERAALEIPDWVAYRRRTGGIEQRFFAAELRRRAARTPPVFIDDGRTTMARLDARAERDLTTTRAFRRDTLRESEQRGFGRRAGFDERPLREGWAGERTSRDRAFDARDDRRADRRLGARDAERERRPERIARPDGRLEGSRALPRAERARPERVAEPRRQRLERPRPEARGERLRVDRAGAERPDRAPRAAGPERIDRAPDLGRARDGGGDRGGGRGGGNGRGGDRF